MAKNPKLSRSQLEETLERLRGEIRGDLQPLAEAVERAQQMQQQLQQQIQESTASSEGSETKAAVASLREDLRTEVAYLSQLIAKKSAEINESQSTNRMDDEVRGELGGLRSGLEQLQASVASMDGSEAKAAVASLGDDLRSEVAYLSKLITKKSAEISEAQGAGGTDEEVRSHLAELRSGLEQLQASVESLPPPIAPPIDEPDRHQAIEALRAEMRNQFDDLEQSVAAHAPRRPKFPFAPALAAGLSLLVGMLGTGLYYERFANEDEIPPQVAIGTQIQAALQPQSETLDQHTTALEAIAKQLEGSDGAVQAAEVQRQKMGELTGAVADLQKSVEEQSQRVEESVKQTREDLTTELARLAAATVEATTVARPEIPEKEGADAPDTAASPGPKEIVDKTDEEESAKVKESENKSVTAGKVPVTSEEGLVIIDNASRFELKLLVNGELVEVPATDKTSVPVKVGKVNTEISGLDLRQDWEDWKIVDGKNQLTIKVRSNSEYYWLSKP